MSNEREKTVKDNVGEEDMGARKSLAEDVVREQRIKRSQNASYGTMSGKYVRTGRTADPR